MIALFGPTGVGKTAVALALAERLRRRGEDPVAVSADALQVYRGLEILTGAATAAERGRLEHRLVGFVDIDRSFSVGEYMPLAHYEIDTALAAGRRPIVVGGTGLYLRAALGGLRLRPPPAPGIRERLEREVEEVGIEALRERLRERAPEAAAGVRSADRTRVIRALELLEAGEDPIPAREGESELWSVEVRRPTLLFGLTMDRAELSGRIDRRVEAMVAAGAPEEVRRALAAGASPTARAALGFEELLCSDVEAMKRRTRRYAKRQLTWMRKLAGVRILDVSGHSAAAVADALLESEAAAPAPARLSYSARAVSSAAPGGPA